MKGLSHKAYMDNYFTFPALSDDDYKKINCDGTICRNKKILPPNSGHWVT
jgi:hypothetical protein